MSNILLLESDCQNLLDSLIYLEESHEIMAQLRATTRWKEWIPLFSQQLRLRNLIQIVAYNVSSQINVRQTVMFEGNKWCQAPARKMKASFYYTLHLTTMSAPFYTSEKLESENPKWAEIEVSDIKGDVNTAVNGIVVRLWLHQNGLNDHVITVWGVYFSGLVYLGPKPCLDPSAMMTNTIVFHMHGGYFTCAECLKETILAKSRKISVALNPNDVHPSYTVNLLLRLHTIQQAIKKQMIGAQNLREKIAAGGFTAANESRESAMLRKLLNKNKPKTPERQEIHKMKKEIEMVKFRVSLLQQERTRKRRDVQLLEKRKQGLLEANQDRGLDLLSKYQNLHKETEHLKEWKKKYVDIREAFLHNSAQLMFRCKQLISELNLIYPVLQAGDKYTICGVHLPNSEDFSGHDEVMISVALGFVAHLVQMISIFLQVPLRYPIIHFGSRSKIIDHIAEKIPDKDREFPLFSRGKDKLQFNYGVYLLNKNIAQLRWYCGLPTQDLRATLPNLTSLLHLRPGPNMLDSHHRTMSGSSLDLRSSSQNASPVSGFRRQPAGNNIGCFFEKGHRVSKSMGNSEISLQIKPAEQTSNNLSYSLDKGLDEYEEMKRAEQPLGMLPVAAPKVGSHSILSHVGSEPILTTCNKLMVMETETTYSSGDEEAQKHFLQNWQAKGPAPVCSDDDMDTSQLNQGHCKLPCSGPERSISNGSHGPPSDSTASQNNINCIDTGVAISWSGGEMLKNGQCEEDGVLAPQETLRMKQLNCENYPPEVSSLIESSMVDSLLARRTEALARRTASFNLVRSRNNSTLEDSSNALF